MIIDFISTLYYYYFLSLSTFLNFLLAIITLFFPFLKPFLHTGLSQAGKVILFFSGCRLIVHRPLNLEKNKAYLFISNHQSIFDIFVLYTVLRKIQFKWIIKKSLFFIPFFGFCLWAAGYINLDRENRNKAYKAIQKAIAYLKKNTSILIFPEGTRSLTDTIQEFKAGSFVIAYHSKAEIVPVILKNTLQIKSKKSLLIRPQPIQVMILDPVKTEDLSRNEQKDLLSLLQKKMLQEYQQI